MRIKHEEVGAAAVRTTLGGANNGAAGRRATQWRLLGPGSGQDRARIGPGPDREPKDEASFTTLLTRRRRIQNNPLSPESSLMFYFGLCGIKLISKGGNVQARYCHTISVPKNGIAMTVSNLFYSTD